MRKQNMTNRMTELSNRRTNIPIMFTGDLFVARVRMAETTFAAPPMSALILSMLEDGFNEIPPLSKVMPLPTKTTGLVSGELL